MEGYLFMFSTVVPNVTSQPLDAAWAQPEHKVHMYQSSLSSHSSSSSLKDLPMIRINPK
jgi:hypothetical protein